MWGRGFWVAVVLAGCGGTPATESERAQHAPADEVQTAGAESTKPQAGKSVAVRGITGSLSAYDVDQAMAKRTDALLECVAKRPGRLGFAGGDVKFRFAVDSDGNITRVDVTESTLGLPRVESCLSEVAAQTQMPRPAGAQGTEVGWQMTVDPMGRDPRELEPEELESVDEAINHQAEAAYEACELTRKQRFVVTAYLGHKGRVLAASARPRHPGHPSAPETDQIDCLNGQLLGWKGMPRIRGRAKLRFDLRWVKAPPEKRRRAKKGRRKGRRRHGRR